MGVATVLVIDARFPERGAAIARVFAALDLQVFLHSGRDIHKIPERVRATIPKEIDLVVMHNDDRGYWDDITRYGESATALAPIRYTGGDAPLPNESEIWIRKRKMAGPDSAPSESEALELLEWATKVVDGKEPKPIPSLLEPPWSPWRDSLESLVLLSAMRQSIKESDVIRTIDCLETLATAEPVRAPIAIEIVECLQGWRSPDTRWTARISALSKWIVHEQDWRKRPPLNNKCLDMRRTLLHGVLQNSLLVINGAARLSSLSNSNSGDSQISKYLGMCDDVLWLSANAVEAFSPLQWISVSHHLRKLGNRKLETLKASAQQYYLGESSIEQVAARLEATAHRLKEALSISTTLRENCRTNPDEKQTGEAYVLHWDDAVHVCGLDLDEALTNLPKRMFMPPEFGSIASSVGEGIP